MDNWKTTVLLLVLGIFVAALLFGFALKSVRQGNSSMGSFTLPSFLHSTPTAIKSSPTPTAILSTTEYSQSDCPKNGWLDCMPAVGESKPLCTKDAITWISSHCSPFYGVAR